jgi:hypothetical protein
LLPVPGGIDDEAVSTAAAGWPGAGDPAPCLSVAAVARRLGVAPATLRTWDRRYGLGPTRHAAGEHRRYAPADIARLDVMRRLVLAGAPPAEAARIAVSRPPVAGSAPIRPELVPPAPASPAPAPAGALAQNAPAAPAVALAVAAAAGERPDGAGLNGRLRVPGGRPDHRLRSVGAGGERGTWGPGGRILAIPGASPEVRGLARAAMTLDAAAAWTAVDLAVRRYGVVAAWDGLLRPVLAAIGTRWETTGTGVEVEHLLTETAIGVLRAGGRAPEPVNGRPVLLACAPGEQHCLPLSALAAALAEHRIGVRLLGGGLPAAALAAAVRRTGAAVVLVFAQLTGAGEPAVLRALPTLRPRVTVLAAGAGWTEPLPDPVRHVADLRSAVDAVRTAVS